jgi:hypothetical protein
MKSILKIDTPNNCHECPLSWFDGRDYYCVPADEIIDDSTKIFDGCPLVEIKEDVHCSGVLLNEQVL